MLSATLLASRAASDSYGAEITPHHQALAAHGVLIARNENYWQSGTPYLDEIVVNVRPDAESTVADLGAVRTRRHLRAGRTQG